MSKRRRSWLRRHRRALLTFAGFATIIPAMILWGECSKRRAPGVEMGVPDGAIAVDRTIVLFDHNEAGEAEEIWARATSVDAATGEIAARRVGEGLGMCWAQTPGRIACDNGETIVYDARTLEPIAGAVASDPPEPRCTLPVDVSLAGTHLARPGKWDVDLGGECQAATVVDGAIVVASDTKHDRVFAIDLATGVIRWRAGY